MEDSTVGGGTIDGARRAPPAPAAIARGTVIGRYVVLSQIGAGGMGLVFAAHDPELDRKVALKVLRDDVLFVGETEGRHKLLREAQALARLAHPNVVTVYDVGVDQGRSFIAMDFIAGQTVRQWLDRDRPSPSAIFAVFLAAGRGLAAAHASGIVHGDFKPQNVLMANDPQGLLAVGRVLVTDFGLARPHGDHVPASAFEDTLGRAVTPALASSPSDRDAYAGTPAYMAPEQFAGLPATPLTDQFAFAVALWEALTGRRPFVGGTLPELAAAVTDGRLDDGAGATIPRTLRTALRRALLPEPDGRHRDLSPLLDVLARDPRRARRRVVIVGVLATVAIVGVGTQQIGRRAALSACIDDGESITAVVDAPAMAKIREAFVATGSAVAEDSADHIARELAKYAAQWSTMRRDNCTANIEGTRDDTHRGRADSCLDDARVELVELVEVLQQASDLATVANGSMTTTRLPLLSACDDEARLASRVPLPDEPGPRERVLESRRRLAKARALWALGRYADAKAVIEPLVAEAEAIAWGPLLPAVLIEQARVLALEGDLEGSERAAKRAFIGALAANDDERAASAAGFLAESVGVDQMRLDLGEDWLDISETLYDRIGDTGYARTVTLANRGRLAELRGDVSGALALQQRALALRTELIGEDHPLLGSILGEIGHLHAERSEFEIALSYFERDLELLQAFGGESHVDIPQLLSDMAGVYGRQRRYDDAERYFLKALALVERIHGKRGARRAVILNNLAILYDRLDRLDEALGYFDEARQGFAESYGTGHPAVATALSNRSQLLRKLGRSDEARSVAQTALEITERALGPKHPDVAYRLDTLAEADVALGRLDDAHAEATRSLEIRIAALEPDDLEIVVARQLLVEVLLEQRAFDDAIRELRPAIASTTTRLGDDHRDVASLSWDLGRAELGRGRRDAAREAYERAFAIWEHDDTSAIACAEVALALADMAWEDGGRDKALAMAQQALDRLREHGTSGNAKDIADVEAKIAMWRAAPEKAPR